MSVSSQRVEAGSPVQVGTGQCPWLAVDSSVHGQVRQRSVYAAQRRNLEEPSWLEDQKTTTFGIWTLMGWGNGERLGGDGDREGIPYPLQGSQSCPCLLYRSPHLWLWGVVLPCVLFWEFVWDFRLTGDFRAWEGLGHTVVRFK